MYKTEQKSVQNSAEQLWFALRIFPFTWKTIIPTTQLKAPEQTERDFNGKKSVSGFKNNSIQKRSQKYSSTYVFFPRQARFFSIFMDLEPLCVVEVMLEAEENWTAISSSIAAVMKRLREEKQDRRKTSGSAITGPSEQHWEKTKIRNCGKHNQLWPPSWRNV